MLDERVRAVLDRLPPDATSRFLFALVAPQTDDDVFDAVVLHGTADAATHALVRERVEPGAPIVSGGPLEGPDLEVVEAGGLRLGVVLR